MKPKKLSIFQKIKMLVYLCYIETLNGMMAYNKGCVFLISYITFIVCSGTDLEASISEDSFIEGYIFSCDGEQQYIPKNFIQELDTIVCAEFEKNSNLNDINYYYIHYTFYGPGKEESQHFKGIYEFDPECSVCISLKKLIDNSIQA